MYALDEFIFTAQQALRERNRFRLAIAISVALHLLAMAVTIGPPHGQPGRPFTARLTTREPPRPAEDQNAQLTKPTKRSKEPQRHVLAMPQNSNRAIAEPPPQWTVRQRNEMDQFLNELATEAKPLAGRSLEQRAKTMARSLPTPGDDDEDSPQKVVPRMGAQVDRFTLEMYLDALTRKLNRTATMVRREHTERGARVAAVRVVLGKDGSVKRFKILYGADQQAEIDYINAVVHQAAPFAAFPQDLRDATDSFPIDICILPNRYGNGDGATFTRMNGRQCREGG